VTWNVRTHPLPRGGTDFITLQVESSTRLEITEDKNLSATTLRVIGILVLVAAAVVAVLNLKRVANLGMMWLSPPLLIVGVALVALAARRK
jgi:hypothetical protein